MEMNESLVIGFLVIVILILIFSKITVSTGSSNSIEGDDYNGSDFSQKPTATRKGSRSGSGLPNSEPTGIIAGQPTEVPENSLGGIEEDDYMSDELKKQIKDMEDRFYYDNCRMEKA